MKQDQEPLPLPQAVAEVLSEFEGGQLTTQQRRKLEALRASLEKTLDKMNRVRAARTNPGLKPVVDRELVKRLRDQGLTLKEIGERAETTPNNVSKILRALKVKQLES